MKSYYKLSIILIAFVVTSMQAQDYWTQKASFVSKRIGASGFSIDDKGYVGWGFDDAGVAHNDFWEYNPVTDIWTQKADFEGGVRGYGTGFGMNGKGYYGTGIIASYNWTKDFWEYDPATNDWTRKADFGGGLRYTALSFSIGNKGYMGSGVYRVSPWYLATYYQDFWEYNPADDTWTRKADTPERGRANATGLSIGDKGYVGMGMYYYDTRQKDWWEYTPATDSWVRKADFKGTQRYGASGFSIGNKAYVGSGGYYSLLTDMWEYDPVINDWTLRASLPGEPRYNPIMFSIGNRGYFGIGSSSMGLNDFYEYTPYTVTLTCPVGIVIKAMDSARCDALVNGLDPIVTVSPAVADVTVEYSIQRGGVTYASGTGSVSGMIFPRGFNSVIYAIPQENLMCAVDVEIEDLQSPVLITADSITKCYSSDHQYAIPPIEVSDNCQIGNVIYSIIGETIRTGVGTDASGFFEVGTSYIEWVVRDDAGNVTTKQTIIEINPPLEVSIPDVYAVNPGGEINTLYVGYGPSSLSYYALALGGTPLADGTYTYAWSDGSTSSGTVVNPSIPGTYSYSVEVTDAHQCTASKAVTVNVIDVRCGRNLDKVQLCRVPRGNPNNASVVCINAADVAEHLLNGGNLGVCTTPTVPDPDQVIVFPNPNNGFFTVRVLNPYARPCKINITDKHGRVVSSRQFNDESFVIETTFDLSYTRGMFFIRVALGDQHSVVKVFVK